MVTMYPTGYGTDELSIGALFVRHHGEKMHPEFRRRLRAWLEAQPDGRLGIGSGFRTTQPVKEGFAPPGKSFHQLQTFRSGVSAYSAVDLVCRVPGGTHSSGAIPLKWVPLQGGSEAKRWGLHVNVGSPGKAGFEVWHLQPVEYDGWDSWVTAGRPDPVAGYLLPGDHIPAPPPQPAPQPQPPQPPTPGDEDDGMFYLSQWQPDGSWWSIRVDRKRRLGPLAGADVIALVQQGVPTVQIPADVLPTIPVF